MQPDIDLIHLPDLRRYDIYITKDIGGVRHIARSRLLHELPSNGEELMVWWLPWPKGESCPGPTLSLPAEWVFLLAGSLHEQGVLTLLQRLAPDLQPEG